MKNFTSLFEKDVLLPRLDDLIGDMMFAGEKRLCGIFFKEELRKQRILLDEIAEDDDDRTDDLYRDTLSCIVNKKLSHIPDLLHSASMEIVIRMLGNFSDNDKAREIMVNTLALELVAEQDKLGITLDPSERRTITRSQALEMLAEAGEDGFEQVKLKKIPKKAILIASDIISSIEEAAQEIVPTHPKKHGRGNI